MSKPDPAAAVPVRYAGCDIVRIRRANNLSRLAFAAYLNMSAKTLAAWEQDAKSPSRMGLKLLSIVDRHGIAIMR